VVSSLSPVSPLLGSAALLAIAASVLACNDVPLWRLGEASSACADASDIACRPFGAPAIVTELHTSDNEDDKPTLTQDRLEMYFLSDHRDGGLGHGDVWVTTRANVSDPWGAPSVLAALNSTSREESPAVSADGTTLWVASDRDGGKGGLDIWVSTRPPGGAWSAPVPVPELNTDSDEFPRPPGAQGLVMPLSRRDGTGSQPYHIFFSSRSAPGSTWSSPVTVPSIDTANLDDDGYLTDDGLTLYFSSDRLNGTQDLFVAQRASPAGDFGPAVALTTLNTDTFAERDPWVSADGHEIYFSSDRTGALQIYRATR
jgi:WD40-like Beta Propeller Repeat